MLSWEWSLQQSQSAKATTEEKTQWDIRAASHRADKGKRKQRKANDKVGWCTRNPGWKGFLRQPWLWYPLCWEPQIQLGARTMSQHQPEGSVAMAKRFSLVVSWSLHRLLKVSKAIPCRTEYTHKVRDCLCVCMCFYLVAMWRIELGLGWVIKQKYISPTRTNHGSQRGQVPIKCKMTLGLAIVVYTETGTLEYDVNQKYSFKGVRLIRSVSTLSYGVWKCRLVY